MSKHNLPDVTVADVLRENPIPTMSQIGKAVIRCVGCQAALTVFDVQHGPDGPLCQDCVDWPRYRREKVIRRVNRNGSDQNG